VTPERWRRVEAVFERVLELPADDRAAALDRDCAGDEELRREVEALLAAHAGAGSFLDSPSLFFEQDAASAHGAGLEPGQVIGRYRVVRELGRGGMGAVYLAARGDQQFEQLVAIKLVKRGMDTDAVIRHFRNERQILAGFDHPNIARLLDGDATEDGRPYFVMEYVDGVPVDEYCDRHGLSVSERLELFRAVCAAVSYAHRRLVVHRDIKPSNILVTADGVPKLLDFGIAKLLQPSDGGSALTATGLRPMTPEYASPEQVRGLPASTATDVYSLGVVLYELLTGQPPYRFTSRSPLDVARTITETEPPRPSTVVATIAATTGDGRSAAPDAGAPKRAGRRREGSPERLRRRLRGDLDNIVLMAMRKEPARRYQSVEQLSEDIRRHLEALPVLARQDTFAYRGAKFLRRNAAASAAAALVFVTLVAGIVATSWQTRRAREAQARAERRFADVRELANAVLFDYHDAIEDLPGATPVRERLLRDALTYLDSLAAEAADDRALQRELAAAYERVGDVRGQAYGANLGDRDGAMESYRKALQMRAALLAAEPREARNRRDLAASHQKVGNLLLDTSDAARGLEHLRAALALHLQLAQEQPASPAARRDLAAIHNDVGLALEDRGELVAALEHHRQARALREALVAADPRDRQARRDLSITYVNTGRVLFFGGDVPGALEINRQALALRSALVDEDRTNADYRRLLAVAYQNEGDYRANQGDVRGALESFGKKLPLDEAALAADPANTQALVDHAYSSERLGALLTELGDHSRALVHLGHNLAAQKKLAAKDPESLSARYRLVLAHVQVGQAQAKLGDRTAAFAACRKAVALLEAAADDPAHAYTRGLRAQAYLYLGDTFAAVAGPLVGSSEEASEHWRAARDMYQRGLDIWADMRRRGSLGEDDVAKFEAIAREVARIDATLLRG
jgi:tetratricopeptide (TPR) repeat protein